jgi:hypothetical protein
MKHLKKFNENKLNESFEEFSSDVDDALAFIKDEGFDVRVLKFDGLVSNNYYTIKVTKNDKTPFNIDQIKPDILAMLSQFITDLNYEISYIYILKEENGSNKRDMIEFEDLRELSGDIKQFAIEFKDNNI